MAELEREREARARLAVAHERGRIARELHDIIAHAVSVIHVQARAARGALHTDIPAADAALEAVERTAGQALGEMRLLLGALHDDAAPARSPQPRLTDLPALVDQYRQAGLPVRIDQADGPPLPAAVGVAAYRIVQESLTNVLEHARPSEVVVRVGATTPDSTSRSSTTVRPGSRHGRRAATAGSAWPGCASGSGCWEDA
ncbi:MAG: sensor histidine kinase [Egibacteraceae bacterium]